MHGCRCYCKFIVPGPAVGVLLSTRCTLQMSTNFLAIHLLCAGLPKSVRRAGYTPLTSDEGPSCGQQAHMSGGGGANGARAQVSSAKLSLCRLIFEVKLYSSCMERCDVQLLLLIPMCVTVSIGECTSVLREWTDWWSPLHWGKT